MKRSQPTWLRTVRFLGLAAVAACGSVAPLGPDGGGGAGAAKATGDAGSRGGAGASGSAGSTGNGGTSGLAGSAGAAQDGGGSPDGAAGTGAVDAAIERSPSCPASYASLAEGAACPVAAGTTCDYDQGRCGCLGCVIAGGAQMQSGWFCRAWDSAGQGCPARSPAIGSPCSTPELFCTYGAFCSISLGDDVECKDGVWQRMISAVGSCSLRTCLATGTDAGADHPPDMCASAAGCSGGACWEQLDGSKACVKPRAAATLSACPPGDTTCCAKDADCTQKTSGRCWPLLDVKENFCGGAVPIGNACRYDQCATDMDCKAGAPVGAAVSTCLPSGALDTFFATCAYGACRTDADCTLHPGGRCQYGQAATNGVCSLHDVLFCAYPSDPCGNADSPACPTGQVCVPNANNQGRQCGAAPPMYP